MTGIAAGIISMVCETCKSAWCTHWQRCQRCGGGKKVKPAATKTRPE